MSFDSRSYLRLDRLDDRLVPSAAVLDLTTVGAEATAASGAIVQQVSPQPTGTGYIRSFVRVQGASSGGGSEQGYNTDARSLQFDENKSSQFTRSITLGQVPVVTVGGVQYREFLLDINQKASSPYLSVDEVRIFLGASNTLTGYDAGAQTLGGQAAAFDLDAGGDVSVKLKATLNSGSGSGDMTLLVPEANFVGADPNSFLYLYSKMGALTGATANGGFEEWAVRAAPPAPPVSPPPTGGISGKVFFDKNQNGMMDPADDFALVNVMIELRVTIDGLAHTVGSAYTKPDGTYSFTGLSGGIYTLIEYQPADYDDGNDYAGTAGGTAGLNPDTGLGDGFYMIDLADGQQGIDYLFTEKERVINPGE